MRFHTVVFDLDGTLLNTLADLAESCNEALAYYGLPQYPVASYKQMVGLGTELLCQRALAGNDKVPLEEFMELRKRLYANRWNSKTKEYGGITSMLMALHAAGLRLAVLSNKSDEFTQAIVSHYFSHIPFAACFGAREGVALKPDPTALFAMLADMGADRTRTLYVGDSGSDMETAKNAGVVAAGVLWGFREKEELLAAGADYLAKSPKDIVSLCTESKDVT